MESAPCSNKITTKMTVEINGNMFLLRNLKRKMELDFITLKYYLISPLLRIHKKDESVV